MNEVVRVSHEGGDRFLLELRQHRLWVDQPLELGGADTAPTPTELFVASLASCIGFYVRRYLARHELPTEGLAVTATFGLAAAPARVGELRVAVRLPAGLPAERQAALLAVASHCTVHNTLRQPPVVQVDLVEPDPRSPD